jgi:hypothetical protein
LFLLALAGAPACASFHARTPEGFAALEDDERYDWRATNADGVVVSVRALRNRPYASLDFWSRAVDDRIQSGGYRRTDARPVETESGLHGQQFRYEASANGRTHHYWVTLFVVDRGPLRRNRVFLLEAGGDQEVFEQAIPAVERTVRAFRL